MVHLTAPFLPLNVVLGMGKCLGDASSGFVLHLFFRQGVVLLSLHFDSLIHYMTVRSFSPVRDETTSSCCAIFSWLLLQLLHDLPWTPNQ